MKLDKNYWDNRYLDNDARWDIGYPSTPIKTYIDQLEDRNMHILIPGGGNAYEAEYLWEKGFHKVHLLDISKQALAGFKKRVPNFPDQQLILSDFFEHQGTYDLIFEQTFFCAINPRLRKSYVEKMKSLLSPKGKLVGLLFDAILNDDRPPFSGNKAEYLSLFEPSFDCLTFELAHNSIDSRAGRELFIKLSPKD